MTVFQKIIVVVVGRLLNNKVRRKSDLYGLKAALRQFNGQILIKIVLIDIICMTQHYTYTTIF